MTPENSPTSAAPLGWLPWLGVLAYLAVRLALLPADGGDTVGFTHDSAYITLVADNLCAGRGYVNDAHWLVFLHPAALPLPFHNANPLYPTLIAAVSSLTGLGTTAAGFAVSAAASALLLAALVWLLGKYVLAPLPRFGLALAATLFSPVFEESLRLLPDTLCTAFLAWSLACLIRLSGTRSAVAAGVCLGLAWLTRSSVILLAPAVLVYLVYEHGGRIALTRSAVFAAAALLVALPWLVHTARVWGNPLRSDSSYYLLEDYHARALGGSSERVWHSPQAPPGLGELLRHEPGAVALFVLRGLPRVLYRVPADWTYGSYAGAALLGGLAVLAAVRLRSVRAAGARSGRRFLTPELAAMLVLTGTLALAFAPRAQSLEVRYFLPLAVLVPLFLLADTLPVPRPNAGIAPRMYMLRNTGMLGAAVLWFGMVLVRDVELYRQMTASDVSRKAYFALAREVQADYAAGRPVVVGTHPYFYTRATGAPALAIPESDDAYLGEYMHYYGARHVFLTREEVAFWRPHWLQPDGLPPQLRPVADLGTALVFAWRDTP